MLRELLIPEEVLQLEKLNSAIELCDDSSFFSILGIDTLELAISLQDYFKKDLVLFHPTTNQILNEAIAFKEKFLFINLFESKDSSYIKNLLFYRDFISDYNLKIIILVKKSDYTNISKDAIDLYSMSTFSYLFSTYTVEIIKDVDSSKLDSLLEEYKSRKKTINKKQKIHFLVNIAKEYTQHGNMKPTLKYLNEALFVAEKLKMKGKIIEIKYLLSHQYEYIGQFKISEKYLLECLKYLKNKQVKNYQITLNTLTGLYIFLNDAKALEYCNEEYSIALNIDDKDAELNALYNYFRFYKNINNLIEAEKYLKKSYELAEELKNQGLLALLKEYKARICIDRGEESLAKEYLIDIMNYYKEIKDTFNINKLYVTWANFYLSLNDYKKSLIYCDWCYKYLKKNNLKRELLDILHIYSINYQAKQEIGKALEMAFERLKLSQQLNIDKGIIRSLIIVSQLFNLQKNYIKALRYLDDIFLLTNQYESELLNIYARYSDTYKNMGELEQAYIYYEKAFSLKQNNKDDESYLYELYGEILVKDNKLEEVKTYFNKSLKIAKDSNDMSRILSLEENLGYLYKNENDISNAKKYFMEVVTKLEVINSTDIRIKTLRNEIKLLT